VQVFPRLVAAEHRTNFDRSPLTSNISELDDLLRGGLDAGSSTLVLGPAGAGKSLLTLHFARAAVERGEKAALFIFDEELGLLFNRAKTMGIDLEALKAGGNLFIEQLDAAELSPGEFAHRVRKCVDAGQVKTVVIDSLNGYQAAMPEENSLLLHIHELLQYLNRQGATTFVTVAQHGLVGTMESPVDITYLADSVILLRYFEALGRVRRAISVIKKRSGPHEDTIREYRIGKTGLSIGKPLEDFQGVLRGVPIYTGSSNPLLETDVGVQVGISGGER
jgi:circadian clock protein KaiC